MATKLDLDKPAAAKPARRRTSRRKPPAAPAANGDPRPAAEPVPPADVPWWRRRSPCVDRILITVALFVAFLWLSIHFAQLEIAWNAAVPGAGAVYNQPHRHVQFAAGTLFGWLLLAVYDLLANRSITLGEAFRNRANPGRGHLFTPMEPVVQAAAIRFYGMQYAAVPIAQALIWGN